MGGIADIKSHLKQSVKRQLVDRQQKKYNRLLEMKTVTYDAWIRNTEKVMQKKNVDGALTVKQIPYEACREFMLEGALQEEKADIILFADSDGEISAFAEELVRDYFSLHNNINMLYGDEDVLSPEGIRYTPWFKPDWSPDTFLSCFYFGSIFAVRTKVLLGLGEKQKRWIWQEGDYSGKSGIYRMCHIIAEESGGFERRKTEAAADASFVFPVGHIDEVLFHAPTGKSPHSRYGKRKDEAGVQGLLSGKISVIIPSKDHAEILKRCINSVKAALPYSEDTKFSCELIVVDNGSSAETKKELEQWLEEQGVLYIYKQMPFNFSGMCNMGAEAAEGEVLLFLNDDVEVPEVQETDTESMPFLINMYRKALQPYTGAVGVKLYYPDSIRIQHAGIVNLRLGPVHKLQFKDDDISYYYGWNRGRRNVIAVTGACLAVEKEKFWESGGFPEELPVAFNDVDLCFGLFEKGYYNLVLQDTVLYHHESLSRGDDDDREKLARLLREKDRLYERHSGMYAKDPFYHKYLAGDMLSTGFELKADYEYITDGIHERVQEDNGMLLHAREDACVIIGLEYAGGADAFAGNKEAGQEYLIQGYSFVAGSDNACYEKRIILCREDEPGREMRILYVKPEILIRRDVEENLPDQINVGMTGFRVVIGERDIAPGTYRIGVSAKDKCSGQMLYSWTNRYLQV